MLINKSVFTATRYLLLVSFFLSGVSALFYQLAWQRSLFGIIGVDIDSVTIVVSVFMLGIGFGGLLGGWLADFLPKLRLQVYGAVELAIATYGLFSLSMLKLLDAVLINLTAGSAMSAAAGFAFLIVPTMLMGITLPLLTVVFDRWQENIGVSVGQLYFINTLGAAAGSGLVPFVLLPVITLQEIVWLAALGNFTVGLLAFSAYVLQKHLLSE